MEICKTYWKRKIYWNQARSRGVLPGKKAFLSIPVSCLWGKYFQPPKVKGLPAMWEIRVQSLGCEDPLEKEMATHSSTLAWKIPWTEEPGRLQSMGSQRVGHDWVTSLLLSLGKKIQEENICISAHMWYIHSWKKILTLKITRLIGNRRVRDRPFTTYSVTKKVYNQRNNKSNNWYLGRSFGCPGKHLGVVWACLMGC